MLQCCARPSVRLSVVCNICVVAKRCILAKNWLKKQIGDRLWQIEWSRDRWRHVTLKDHKVMTPIRIGPNIPKTDCYIATITNCYSLLWGSALGYPGDSLASCLSLPSQYHFTVAETESAVWWSVGAVGGLWPPNISLALMTTRSASDSLPFNSLTPTVTIRVQL